MTDEAAAMAHDDLAVKATVAKYRLQLVSPIAPLPDSFSVLACCDSSKANAARNTKDSIDSTTEPRAEDESDVRPHKRDDNNLPRFFAANTRTRNRYDSRLPVSAPRVQSTGPASFDRED